MYSEIFYLLIPVGVLFIVICVLNLKKFIKNRKKKVETKPKEEKKEQVEEMGVKYGTDNYMKISIPSQEATKSTTQEPKETVIVPVDEKSFIITDEEKEFYGDDVSDIDDFDLLGENQENEILEIYKNKESSKAPHNKPQNKLVREIKSLSPEMKLMMFTNILDKKD